MQKSERADWGDFPPAIANGFISSLSSLEGYKEAKAGDTYSALNLVLRLMKDETIKAVKEKFKPTIDTLIVPIHAEEATGRNKIPLAIAEVLAHRIGCSVYKEIVQTNRVRRTGSNANHRLAFPPTFNGKVEAGKNYIIVDDTLTQGGTLASLRGYIENRGGKVLGMLVMSAKNYSLQIAPNKRTIENILLKHGTEINDFWKEEFGYGIERLTQSEANQLYVASDINEIRDRLAQARLEESIRNNGEGISEKQSGNFAIEGKIISLLKEINQEAILRTEKPSAPCRGSVVYVGEDFIIQQVAEGSRYFQIHKKADLSNIPNLGEKVNISYSSKEKLARVRLITPHS